MIYSVWNQGALQYDYYETPETQDRVNAPMPTHLRQTKLGLTPRQAAWPLPAEARPVGRGTLLRGRVASAGGGALGDIELGKAALVIGVGLVAMFLVMR